MVVDTSVLVAILTNEPELRQYAQTIDEAESKLLSVASFVEASIVLEKRSGAEGVRDLDLFIKRSGINLVEVDAEQGQLARYAFSRFGKGRHPAALNFGDCFAYALATALGQPLLFKGRDFALTDVGVAELSGEVDPAL
jgi:ribonuclease VapC